MSGASPQVVNDRYELVERIGRGGMAEVWRARDLLLDREVAIKMLFPENAADPAFVERFRREAQAAAGLNHQNIVGVYDWGQHGSTYFMAMEVVKGNTLAQIIRRLGTLRAEQAATLGMQIADALAFAHRNGVVHRDVKPANILITDDGTVKVADFGIARAISTGHEQGLTQDGSVMGTATYFSPEQAKGEAADPRSDLYSLGIVLYEMLAGRPPFVGDTALATAYKQVHDNPEPLDRSVPAKFSAIVAKCMAKDPARRYPNADLLRDDLRAFRTGGTVVAFEQAMGRMGFDNLEDALTTVVAPVAAEAIVDDAATGQPVTEVLQRTQVMPAGNGGGDDMVLPDYDDGNKGRGYVFGAVAAVLVLIAGAIFLVTSVMGNEGMKVPNVVGMAYADAAKLLTDDGFLVTPNPVAREGEADEAVYEQNPAANAPTKAGDTITLTYNPSKPPVAVPAIQGLTFKEATDILTPLGLTLQVVETRTDPTLGFGQIITQDPQATQQVPSGSTVKVVISGGAGQVIVPNVAGQTSSAAQTLLQGAPYKFVVTIENEASATVPKGSVTRTDPLFGMPADSGSAVKVFVSSGPEQVAVPSVEGKSLADADAALKAVGLASDIRYVTVPAGDPNDGKVISQGTAADTKVDPGAKIVLTVGKAAAATTTTAPPAG
ncbi:MAG: Stk1 family PASTA domain-containing Ser/Thr kinase [Ilumatobacteraceae bacterium]